MTLDWIDEAVRTFPVRSHAEESLVPERTALLIVDVQRHWTDPDGPVASLLRREYPDLHAYFYDRLESLVLPNLQSLLAATRAAGVRPIFVTFGSLLPDGADLVPRRRRRVGSQTGAAPVEVGPTAANSGRLRPAERGSSGDGPSGGRETTARIAMRAGEPLHEICPALAVLPGDLVLNKNSSSAFNSTVLDQILRNLGVDTVIVAGLVSNGCVDLTARDASDLGFETTVAEDACAAYQEDIHRAALVNFARVYGSVRTTHDLVKALADGA